MVQQNLPSQKNYLRRKFASNAKKETGRGIPHHCTPTAAKRNIAEMITSESTSSQEQILSQGLKKNLNEKGKYRKEDIQLTGMQDVIPLSLTVGKSQEKPHPELITPMDKEFFHLQP